jgi:hypothetical protein
MPAVINSEAALHQAKERQKQATIRIDVRPKTLTSFF